MLEPSQTSSAAADPNQPEAWLSLDYVHDQIQAQLEHQFDLWESVDGHLRLILGVIGIAFAAALGLHGLSGVPALFLPIWVAVPAATAVALYLLAAGIVGVAYLPTSFDWPPKPEALRRDYLLTDPRITKLDVVDTLVAAYNRNERLIGRKTSAFVVAFGLTALATVILGAALIGNIAWNTYRP